MEKYDITTDNVFADLGLVHAADLKERADFLFQISTFIKEKKLSRKQVAEKLEISHSKVLKLFSAKISYFNASVLRGYLSILTSSF